MEKILTIAIAAYNVENYIAETLDSLVSSECIDSLEILIVNDGSKDSTEAISEKYRLRYPSSIKVVNKENGGWGSTLNTAIEVATGKYFKQLDGDDFFSTDNLDSFVEYLKTIESDFVSTPFVTFTDGTNSVRKVIGCQDWILEGTELPIKDFEWFIPAMHMTTFRTKLLQMNKISITEKCFYTDVEFVLKAYNCCSTLSFFNLPIYYYRLARDGQSMSIAGIRKNYKDHLRMLKGMLEYEKTMVKNSMMKKIFKQRLKEACYYQYLFFLALEPSGEHKAELVAFDLLLKEKYPDYYNENYYGAIKLLRKTSFLGYGIIANLKMLKDKRKKSGIFEGA